LKQFSVITHICFTLCSLLATLLLLAIGVGLIPNQAEAKIASRVKICENLAIQFCGVPHENIIGTFEGLAPHIVERNEDILSIAFRGTDGQLVSATGDHEKIWRELPDEKSTSNQVQIPILKDEQQFGTIEIAFGNLYEIPFISYLKANNFLFVTLVSGVSFLVFRFYLKRVLRYLDPSSVIPGRVKAVLDNLTESVVVLDNKEQIVFANAAFCETTNQLEKSVIGKKLSVFAWHDPNKGKNQADLPWLKVLNEKAAHINIPLILEVDNGKKRFSLVNAMPILGPEGEHRGTLTSFTDVTELEEKNKELVEVSRSAGMAEVATSVLHNVGNILNSVNVTSTLIDKTLGESKLVKLQELSEMMREHENDMSSFLSEDQRGKYIPGYLIKTIDILSREREKMIEMVHSLCNNVDYIKEVIRKQQSFSKIRGCEVSVSIREMIDDAIQMNKRSLELYDIEVIQQFGNVDYINIDRQSVLQIVVNLIKNSADALAESQVKNKRIVIHCDKTEEENLKIKIEDNGVGIMSENLTAIFRHGFTTKEKGHGFGLHGSALIAKEMGGSLNAYSDGPEQGATFELILPFK